MMIFVNPQYVPFYLLSLIPIIIHLIRFSRYRIIYYSDVNFLRDIQKKVKTHNEIRNLLLLLVRVLFILSLVSIFTKPQFLNDQKKSDDADQKQSETTLIYFDNSLTMNYPSEDGMTLLDKAKKDIVDLLENDFFISENIFILSNNIDNSAPLDKQSAKQEVIKMDYTYKNPSLNDIFHKCQIVLNQNNQNKKRLIILSTKSYDTKIDDPKIDVNFLRLYPNSQENIMIQDVYIENLSSQEKILNVIVFTGLLDQKIDTDIKLYVKKDGDYSLLSSKKINVKYRDTIPFNIYVDRDFESGKILIEDNISNVDYDDDFYFTIKQKNNSLVSRIISKNGLKNSDISKIFEGDNATYNTQRIDNLNFSDIKKSKLIILDEVDSFDGDIAEKLEYFLEEGKNIVIVPNENMEIDKLNMFLKKNEISEVSRLFEQEVYLDDINYEHNFFKDVFGEKLEGNYNLPFARKYFISKNISSDILAKFSDGESAILYKKIKNGSVLFFTFPLNEKNSDMYDHSIVVPLFYNGLGNNSTQNIYAEIGVDYEDYFYDEELYQNTEKRIYLDLENKYKIIPNYNINSSREIKISTYHLPEKKGNYNLMVDTKKIAEVSYNFDREHYIYEQTKNVYPSQNIENIKINFLGKMEDNILWGKFFVVLSLSFLLLEASMLKRK